MPKITILADLLRTSHVEKLDRSSEFDVLILAGQGEDLDRLNCTQRVNYVTYHDLRRRGTRRNANNFDVMQPLRLNFAPIGNKVGRNASFYADFTQAIRVRAVFRANHENHVDQLC